MSLGLLCDGAVSKFYDLMCVGRERAAYGGERERMHASARDDLRALRVSSSSGIGVGYCRLLMGSLNVVTFFCLALLSFSGFHFLVSFSFLWFIYTHFNMEAIRLGFKRRGRNVTGDSYTHTHFFGFMTYDDMFSLLSSSSFECAYIHCSRCVSYEGPRRVGHEPVCDLSSSGRSRSYGTPRRLLLQG